MRKKEQMDQESNTQSTFSDSETAGHKVTHLDMEETGTKTLMTKEKYWNKQGLNWAKLSSNWAFFACLLNYFPAYLGYCPVITVNSDRPKSNTSHPLNFHQLYLVNFKFIMYWPVGGGSLLRNVTPSYPLPQKLPKRLSTSYLLTIYGQFQAASLLSRVGGGGWGW